MSCVKAALLFGVLLAVAVLDRSVNVIPGEATQPHKATI